MTKNPPSLSIATEKVCFIVVKAREFDVKDVVTDPDDASNAMDDAMISVLEDHADDPERNAKIVEGHARVIRFVRLRDHGRSQW